MKKVFYFFTGMILVYLLLMIPLGEKENIVFEASQIPFVWNQDHLWKELETSFNEAKSMDPQELDTLVSIIAGEADKVLLTYEDTLYGPNAAIYRVLENSFFMLAPLIAAQENPSEWYKDYYTRIRKKIKSDSYYWDMDDPAARITIYRLLYGMRAAVEEILLQVSEDNFQEIFMVEDHQPTLPSAEIQGIMIQSGDLLVSRGGAEVSAFISRGNDYPGNFSHVAIAYVEEGSDIPYFVEAHIEKGVAIASLEEYLKDEKLRFMVMRPKNDLPVMIENPQLPHEAAKFIFDRSLEVHIPYDFKMDYYDSSAMFCSEVGSFAYKQFGLNLWEFESTISSDGIVSWLQTFGVENFVTQMPSDLEYDPNLWVIGEWRNQELLFKDHLDNAVMDALITRANNGERLSYKSWQLPLARILKGYSFLLNLMGKDGIIPEGMTATRALKNNDFVERFNSVRTATEEQVNNFVRDEGYKPPYWQIVNMAETVLN